MIQEKSELGGYSTKLRFSVPSENASVRSMNGSMEHLVGPWKRVCYHDGISARNSWRASGEPGHVLFHLHSGEFHELHFSSDDLLIMVLMGIQ